MDRPTGTIERVGGYRVVRRLATGGTADVLLAKAEGPHGFERTVVLKLLLSQYRDDEEHARLFAREASAYARLSHPCIVKLYDFFALEGQLVMVLEHVDGPPLSRLRGMLKAVGQPLDDQGSIHVAMRVFGALASAHSATEDGGAPAPVIHRDVNPSNVLVSWDGHVKLADFGVAKVTGVSGASGVGLLKGTFGYMAPEQVRGDAATPRADVYAAAVILWELLARRRAFQRGALPEAEALRLMAEPKIVSIDVLRPDVDRGVRDVLRRALEPDAERRRVTAEEIMAVLRSAVPPETGRERLTAALASVRHEPRASMTSIPPSDGEPTTTGSKPVLPRPGLVPRAEIALKRTPTAAPLAIEADADDRTTEAPTTEKTVRGPEVKVLPTESARELPPMDAIALGRDIRATIDEILRDIPSSIPPATFRGRDSVPKGEERAPPRSPTLLFPAREEAAGAREHTVAMKGTSVVPRVPETPMMAPRPASALPVLAPAPASPPPLPPELFAQEHLPPPPPPPAAAPAALPVLPDRPSRPLSFAPPPCSHNAHSSLGGAASLTGPYAELEEGPPKRRGSAAVWLAAAAVVLVIAVAAGTFAYLRFQKGPEQDGAQAAPVRAARASASAPAPTSASAPASAPAPTSASASASAPAFAPASARPTASAAAAPGLPSNVGLLRTRGLAAGHRIFVDGVVRGQTPDEVKVRCGAHTVKIGSSGKPRSVAVPCGGAIDLAH